MEITTARVLDKRRMLKKTRTYRLGIRVTYDRKSIIFPTRFHLREDDFDKLSSPRLGEELREIRDKFIEEQNRAKEIIKYLGTFTFTAFREEFCKKKIIARKRKQEAQVANVHQQDSLRKSPLANGLEGKNKKYGRTKFDRIRSNVNYLTLGPVAVGFGDYIKILEAQERIGTSENYFSSLISFLKFKVNLRFEDVTVRFLFEYESWCLAKKLSYTTIGIHTRCMRAIFNNQIADGLLPQKSYPFGKRKYPVPSGANVKKALDLSDIKKIYDYEQHYYHPNEMYARDMWMFGYFANGINPTDIAGLKYKNIDGEFITLIRMKTRFTARAKPKNIVIALNDDMKEIIRRWGNKDQSCDNYIFPVLVDGLSAHRRRELIQSFTAMIIDWMKKIASHVGIKKKVRTMEYRHTMATVLKRSGATPQFIQEAMGHTSLATTENYLDSFELDVKKHFANNLLAFKSITNT